MEQKTVKIGEVDVPVIFDRGEEWFPITLITTKVLLRCDRKSLINNRNEEKYSKFISNKLITFSSTKQQSKCINKEGLITLLKNIKIGWLTEEQRKVQNKFHEYLGIPLLPVDIENDEDILIKTFNEYRKGNKGSLPDMYDNKESYIKMLKHLYTIGKINVNNLTCDFLVNKCGLRGMYKHLSFFQVYQTLFGDDFYLYVWKYPKFQFKDIKLNYDMANSIFKNFLKENGIVIEDIFSFSYYSILNKCGLKKFINGNLLYFIVQFFDFRYAGYKFKTGSVNYYKDINNLLFDLRYLIEEDMKLEIEKIPLYLTKTKLREKANPMYHYIISKDNGSIYEWVDKLYPNKFNESDFEINAYRDTFGSDSEYFIDQILRENFNNVIYNQIHTERTIDINGMIPDWLIITNSGVWVVEYFGLYEERQYGKSSRVTDYIDKTKRKIERYKELQGYKFIFWYPNDIEGDFKRIRESILKMKENPYVSMV
jgi:hypothetical protein